MTKQEADALMKIPGNIKGAIFHTHAMFIRYKQGEGGIKMVEEKLKELGYPLKFKEIKSLKWYPEALSVLTILTAKDIFHWTENDIFEMGNAAPKYSFVVKVLIRHFLSIQRTFKEAGLSWKKNFDFGELEPHEINEQEKYLVLRVKGYKFHPLICVYHKGYFLRFAQFVLKGKNITVEETKCVFKGDPYHEYVVRWE